MPRTKRTASLRSLIPAHTNGTGPKTFNIASRYANDTAKVHLMDPTTLPGEALVDTGGWIEIESMNSDAANAARADYRSKLDVVDGEVRLTDEQSRETFLEQVIAVTRSWNLADASGPIPCTPDTVRSLYTDTRTRWVYPQVRNAYLDLTRFFGTGTPSS